MQPSDRPPETAPKLTTDERLRAGSCRTRGPIPISGDALASAECPMAGMCCRSLSSSPCCCWPSPSPCPPRCLLQPPRPFEAHAVALEAKYLVGRCIAFVALLLVLPLLLAAAIAVRGWIRGPGAVPPVAASARTGAELRHGQAAHHVRRGRARIRRRGVKAAARAMIRASRRVGRYLRPLPRRRAAAAVERAPRRHGPRGPAPRAPRARGRASATDVPGYARRHRVRVGLTGLAQVQGSRGATCIATRAAARQRLHRRLVARAGPQDPRPHRRRRAARRGVGPQPPGFATAADAGSRILEGSTKEDRQMAATADETRVVDGVPHQLFIGGAVARRDAAAPRSMSRTRRPARRSPGRRRDARGRDGGARRGRRGVRGLARRAPRERGEILRRAYEPIAARADDLALLMTLEMGKPLAESRGRDRLRRRVPALVRRGGGPHPRPLRSTRRQGPRADDAPAGRAVPVHHARGTSRSRWARARSARRSPPAAPWSSSRPSRRRCRCSRWRRSSRRRGCPPACSTSSPRRRPAR